LTFLNIDLKPKLFIAMFESIKVERVQYTFLTECWRKRVAFSTLPTRASESFEVEAVNLVECYAISIGKY